MYRSILVPLDGSAAAEQALPMALSLARRFGAALTIIHVHVPTWGVYGEGGVYDSLIDREIREGMRAYLDGIVPLTDEIRSLKARLSDEVMRLFNPDVPWT